jgi:histidinol-phosphatase (PHP family)
MDDIKAFLHAFFDAQFDMLRTHQPEVVGHIDLCLLWTPDISLRSADMGEVWEKVIRNVEYAITYGGLFEANAAAIRKGWKTSYPNPDILQVSLSVRTRRRGNQLTARLSRNEGDGYACPTTRTVYRSSA